MSRRSRAAVARSTVGDRWGVLLIGLLALVSGLLALATGLGLLGEFRADQPLLDPATTNVLGEHPNVARVVAAALGVLLFVLGLVWAVRSLRPEPRPRVVGGEDDPAHGTVQPTTAQAPAEPASSPPQGRTAVVDVITAAATTLPGVAKAKVRLVGSDAAPALRLTLWLAPEAEVRAVCDELEVTVLAPARNALVVPALPAAVRLRLT